MKSEHTEQLEKAIWKATNKQGVFGCFEVTIGWFGSERADYITYDTKGIWRCYEIKVSKQDFHSKCKKTFIGHFNYYVMPHELYEEVKHEIPKHIGVYTGSQYVQSVKKAKRCELKVDANVLKDSLLRSLHREYEKIINSSNKTLIELKNREITCLTTKNRRVEESLREWMGRYWELKDKNTCSLSND